MAGEGLPIEVATRVCGVSNSGFYSWRSRAPSERAIRHVWLTDQIVEIHSLSRGAYGARRVLAELNLGRGIHVGRDAVSLLMRRADIQGLPGNRTRRRKAPATPTALDLVHRAFDRVEPNRLWVTDIERHEALLNPAVVKGHRLRLVAASC
jgi:putative transposase